MATGLQIENMAQVLNSKSELAEVAADSSHQLKKCCTAASIHSTGQHCSHLPCTHSRARAGDVKGEKLGPQNPCPANLPWCSQAPVGVHYPDEMYGAGNSFFHSTGKPDCNYLIDEVEVSIHYREYKLPTTGFDFSSAEQDPKNIQWRLRDRFLATIS